MSNPNILQQIHDQFFNSVQNGYHGQIHGLQIAATLALLPNWRAVLDDQFAAFVLATNEQLPIMKDNVSSQVAPEIMIESRGAVDKAVEESIAQARANFETLIATIEHLQTIPTGEETPPNSNAIPDEDGKSGVILTGA